ncbi:hypothetical protein VOLCADRAFT_115761 [Volvox carteri f. nagariensis]|uniref:Thioredoxin domain-containing protein n=1 Tax=Volvox carteri f. nagariensis TaxID=3068 RepID=D8TI49_VOLCA|nr:uncharacterized protein VOLCADRAFT_115761 [Volvox carteri f. nagariensis]EFJ53176.1 hypothetical protein VOLCADRAFT_115761 [Volvox carteri f. nagariensis]|eukprot:XP_002946181.1 hypothetical protein VOLCADRAFT_115761 [Volvox carteri f. nagariensis]
MYLIFLALTYLALIGSSGAAIDADKAAELSREIREHFRQTGANWVSPRMFLQMNLTRNIKPIMFVYTSRSCADCRDFMASWNQIDRVTLSSLTAQFVSVLALDDYAIELSQYSPPDVDFLPRVVFADSYGKLLSDKDRSQDELPYFYDNARQVVEAMRRHLTRHWEAMGTDVFAGDLTEDLL